jgi:hypothetical protein
MIMERRESDRTLSERMAVMETQYLNSALILNQIKQDIHDIATTLRDTDSSLEKRVTTLERSKVFLTGAWWAVTLIISAIIYLQQHGIKVF